MLSVRIELELLRGRENEDLDHHGPATLAELKRMTDEIHVIARQHGFSLSISKVQVHDE